MGVGARVGFGSRRSARSALVGVLAGLTLLCAADPAGARLSKLSDRQITSRLIEYVFQTPSLEEPAPVFVLLPDGYHERPKRRWPVVYLYHSAFGDHSAWYYGLDLERLTAGYPAIFVMPDGGNGGWHTDHWNNGRLGPPRWETYHVNELVSFVDANFRTIPNRRGRALLGASMGGFGAISYAARHPDRFGAAASISGALNTNWLLGDPLVTFGSVFDRRSPASIYGPRLTEEVRWRGHNPFDLAANLAPVAVQIRTHNGEMGGPLRGGPDVIELMVHEMSESVHRRLAELGIPHTWADYGPGTHSIPYAIPKVRDALVELRRFFADPPPRPKTFSHVAIEPEFSVWGWRFVADPARALEFLQVRDASRRGVTLIGSGTEAVRTAPYFRRAAKVKVTGAGAPQIVKPDRKGRITFSVDLGPAHEYQQHTIAARLHGEGDPSYFTRRTVTFAPKARRR